MKNIKFITISLILILTLSFLTCNKGSINPNIPDVVINITIDPNSPLFQELNTVGGYLYLDEQSGVDIPSGSRGIIVYREGTSSFLAYERQPPNEPDLCCNSSGSKCTKLIVGDYYPFVKDTCTGILYYLLDGNIFEGEGTYPLIEYYTVYESGLLHVYN